MDNIFNSVKLSKPSRNLFDLSFDNKLTLTFGELVPVLCQEMLPGDEFRLNTEAFVRFMPLLAPVMHKIDVSLHTFFVPNRLIFKEWNDFLVNNSANGTAVPVPPNSGTLPDPIVMPSTDLDSLCGCINAVLNNGGVYDDLIHQNPIGSLADYLGIPTTGVNTARIGAIQDKPFALKQKSIRINLLPFRAYQLIYNEYYRDENLIAELSLFDDGGYRDEGYWSDPNNKSELVDLFTLRRRAWKKDYFTASLPWTQRGSQVILPIGGYAPVTGDIMLKFSDATDVNDRHWLTMNPGGVSSDTTLSQGTLAIQNFSADGSWSMSLENAYASLAYTSAGSINDIRAAFRIQEWLEKNARCGSRYIEQIMAHFGVMTPDARLQRPEFLGGSKFTVNVGEVMQTSPYPSQESVYPPGIPFGKATAYDNQASCHYYCYEHGFVITIASVMPKANYFQGISRMWTRMSAMDYYWPEFANLGEQSTRMKELFVPLLDPNDPSYDVDPDSDFGYMPRYTEYRCNEDTIHCDFRESLNYWHLARIFTDIPVLNQDFIEVRAEADGLERIFSVFPEGLAADVEASKHDYYGKPIIMEVFNDFKALRPLPVYAVPSLV